MVQLLLLLIFILFQHVVTSQSLTTYSSRYCCHLSTAQLNALKGTHTDCPDSNYWSTKANKCSACPTGTCRATTSSGSHHCVCPDYFIKSSITWRYHETCERGFGSAWPESVGQSNVFLRSCVLPALAPPSSVSPKTLKDFSSRYCCHLTNAQLTAMLGTHSSCPESGYWRANGNKCSSCPAGTCRATTKSGSHHCVCPRYFLTPSTTWKYHTTCESGFGSTWPESAGKSNIFLRSCVTPAATPSVLVEPKTLMEFSSRYCCHLTTTELTAMKGTNAYCPESGYWSAKGNKCSSCPSGTCRATTKSGSHHCVCPQYFLTPSTTWKYHTTCESGFGLTWPESVGKSNAFLRSCATPVATPTNFPPVLLKTKTLQDFSSRYCCHLTQVQLESMRGTHSSCPDSEYWRAKGNKCSSCPDGTCRFTTSSGSHQCVCPDSFLKSSSTWKYHERCENGFGSIWPESAGKENVFLRSCAGSENASTKATKQLDDSATKSENSEPPTPNQDETAKSTSNVLGSAEVIAAIIGGIFSVIAALIGVHCVKKHRKG